jgi:hypothetical protein
MRPAEIAAERLRWCVWNDRMAMVHAQRTTPTVDRLRRMRNDLVRRSARHELPTECTIPESAVATVVAEFKMFESIKHPTHWRSPRDIERELRAGLMYIAGMRVRVGADWSVSFDTPLGPSPYWKNHTGDTM